MASPGGLTIHFVYARSRLRVDESIGEARALRDEVTAWRSAWELTDAMGGHLTQLDLLTGAVLGLVDAIAGRTAAIDLALGTGAVYEECRADERRLLHARRLWRWYADKFDQRSGPGAGVAVQTLRAADEVIWSCWKGAFTALGETVPAAPIPYLAPQFSASATPRTDPPPDMRPGTDDLLRAHVERLPVAAIGLPPVCCRRPWWLILSAHEASHHLQFELDGVERSTQERVVSAAYAASGDAVLAESWRPWCRELFADACSVLLTGPAAIWAVSELETRTGRGMRKSPSASYPPPVIRLALLDAVARQAGLPAGSSGPEDRDELDDQAEGHVKRLLGCVDGVAAALLRMETPAGRPLRALGTSTAAAYADDGVVAGWRSELLGQEEAVPRQTLDAARFCTAAGVGAWQRSAGQQPPEPLAGRLRSVLPGCREPGTRAGQAAADPAAVARQFAADLYEGERRA
jgi:hypothetical protein